MLPPLRGLATRYRVRRAVPPPREPGFWIHAQIAIHLRIRMTGTALLVRVTRGNAAQRRSTFFTLGNNRSKMAEIRAASASAPKARRAGRVHRINNEIETFGRRAPAPWARSAAASAQPSFTRAMPIKHGLPGEWTRLRPDLCFEIAGFRKPPSPGRGMGTGRQQSPPAAPDETPDEAADATWLEDRVDRRRFPGRAAADRRERRFSRVSPPRPRPGRKYRFSPVSGTARCDAKSTRYRQRRGVCHTRDMRETPAPPGAG